MDYSTPGLPVHHQLLELAQTHVHHVSDAIQPSHPLPSPSPAFNLSQYQGLFQWVSSSRQVAEVWGFSFIISPSVCIHNLLQGYQSYWIRLTHTTSFHLSHLSEDHVCKCSHILWCLGDLGFSARIWRTSLTPHTPSEACPDHPVWSAACLLASELGISSSCSPHLAPPPPTSSRVYQHFYSVCSLGFFIFWKIIQDPKRFCAYRWNLPIFTTVNIGTEIFETSCWWIHLEIRKINPLHC